MNSPLGGTLQDILFDLEVNGLDTYVVGVDMEQDMGERRLTIELAIFNKPAVPQISESEEMCCNFDDAMELIK